jgi:hypothetical protein
LLVEVASRVGEGGEHDHLAVPRVDRIAALVGNHLAEGNELRITGGVNLPSG